MLARTLHFTLVFLLASSVFAAPLRSDNNQNQLLLKTGGFKLVDKNVKYDGAETDSGAVCLHYDPVPYGGRNYYWSDAMSDGLYVDGGHEDSKIYQPYELAHKAGWHKKREDPDTNNNVWGVFEFGGRIWMGSNGLGILELDPAQNLWSRYDWQYAAEPESYTYLLFVDQHYLFFIGHGARWVYSRKYDLSAQLATPLDSRLDVSQRRNRVEYLQFINPDARQSYYTALEKEFKRLAARVNPS
jgi:hypothetical protein